VSNRTTTEKKVVFVLGLQGIGKSRWIAENCPGAARIDFEDWWEHSLESMESFEVAMWTKMMAHQELIHTMHTGYESITVECTGVTKVNQAAVRAMLSSCVLAGYSIDVVYLKPVDEAAFEETLWDNPGALDMLRDCQRQRRWADSPWRQPTSCPYLKDYVRVVEIDHSKWEVENQPEEFKVEVKDV